MLIRYFILKQSAKIVCSEMLDLLHRDDTDNILQEDSEIGQYRAKLLAQADRLILANDKISSVWEGDVLSVTEFRDVSKKRDRLIEV